MQAQSMHACKLVCLHTMCLHARAHISAKLGQIKEIKISMDLGEQNEHV